MLVIGILDMYGIPLDESGEIVHIVLAGHPERLKLDISICCYPEPVVFAMVQIEIWCFLFMVQADRMSMTGLEVSFAF